MYGCRVMEPETEEKVDRRGGERERRGGEVGARKYQYQY